jgi:hypothetical protein
MSFFRRDGTVNTALGVGVSGVDVYVCTQPANTGSIPPSPLATIYADSSGTPLANPVLTDGLGNFFFYAATGAYTLVYFDPLGRIAEQIFPDQQVVSPGGGSVSSVGMTVPVGFSISGSPVTASGVLGLGFSSDWNANTFIAGPTGGGAGSPTRRTLVAADLPAGTGTVSSVAATITTSSGLLSVSVSGSPITGSGTLAFTVNLANENANTFFAGPASGGAGPVTARALVAADIFSRNVVAYSAAPQFNAGLSASPTFDITLTGNVSSSTIINPTDGQVIRFLVRQDGSGGHVFTWPVTTAGASPVSVDPNTTSAQEFVYETSNNMWRAVSPGIVTSTAGGD